jgi:hypothetical protein
MATSYSPKIITDGLVFMYDTDDGKSYKGEPTTNLITSNGIDFSQMSTYGTLIRSRVSDSNSPSGYACEMEYPNSSLNSASRIRFGDSTNIPTSGNAFVSIMAKFEGGPSSNIYPRIYSGSSWQTLAPLDGGLTYLTSEYRRFGVNAYLGTGSGGPLPAFSMTQSNSNNQAGQKTRWHSPQVELKSHATPYVDGTRSATQGLLDRTGNTTIDLSNASFDSNAQMTFDGTNDYAEVADQNSLDLTTAMSFEFVVKPDSSQSNPYPRLIDKSVYLLHLTSTSPFGVYQNIYTSGGLRQTGISSVVTAGNWNHIVCTYDGQYGKIYVDAELVKTRDFGSVLACNTNSSSLKIAGDGTTNRPLNGEMPISKIYNKVLTASEVLQNYNATKGRFS